MIRVFIVDDQPLMRDGLKALLAQAEDIEVIGEASDGAFAVGFIMGSQPDVVLMDIFMPDGDGLQALRQIRERFPNVQVVMLTSSESDEHLYQAVQSGAAGYLLKNLDAEKLFDLINGVTQGDGSTIDVYFFMRNRERFHGRHGDNGERFVAVLLALAVERPTAALCLLIARHVEEVAERAQRYALAARRLRPRRRRAEATGAETRSQTLP